LFVNSSGSDAGLGIAGRSGFSAGSFKGLAWSLVTFPAMIAGLISVVDVFLFKNRVLQSRLTITAGALSLLTMAFMAAFVVVAVSEQAKPEFSYRSFVPLLNLILLLLAYRRIMKDENLVKSLDRLR